MAECVAVEAPEENLPSALSIYELITANRLDQIRSLLNPLTLRDRQSIVYQKVHNKTLLRRACDLSFRQIAKYFLDECGADIAERDNPRSKLSPLRVSINNVDLSMLTLLLSRDVVAGDVCEAIKCAQYVLKGKHFTIFSILKKYMDEIALGSMESSADLRNLLNLMPNMDFTSARSYLRVVASGDVDRIKTLLSICMDPKARNEAEENALCVAILNEKSNAEHFLLNYGVFSFKEYVRALEMCGAKFIVFTPNFEKGIHCWRKALRIRTERFLGVSDKFEKELDPDLGIEFSIEKQLDKLVTTHADAYMQALIVFIRLLSPSSNVLRDAFMTVAQNPVIHKDLMQAITLLAELVEFPYYPDLRTASPTSVAIDTLRTMLDTHFHCEPRNMVDHFKKFKHLMQFLKANHSQLFLYREKYFPSVVYIQLLKLVHGFMISSKRYKLSEANKIWIRKQVTDIMKWHSDPYPTTLLHLSISEMSDITIMYFILSCTDDVNCRDNQGNTPMHNVCLLPAEHPDLLDLVNKFSKVGCHIDSSNQFGITPFAMLKRKGVVIYPLKFITLKCLAAGVIHENRIRIPKIYPAILLPFIKAHSYEETPAFTALGG